MYFQFEPTLIIFQLLYNISQCLHQYLTVNISTYVVETITIACVRVQMYHTPKDTGEPTTKMQLGRWCGPSFDVGDVLCNAVLNSKGSILHKTSVFPLKPEETSSEVAIQMKRKWDTELKEKLGDRIKGLTESDIESDKYFCPHWDTVFPEYQKYNNLDMPAPDDITDDTFESPPDFEILSDPAEIDRWTSLARIRTMRGNDPVLASKYSGHRARESDTSLQIQTLPICLQSHSLLALNVLSRLE